MFNWIGFNMRWGARLDMLNRATIQMFIIWLLIVPPGIFYIFINYAPQEINWYQLILFTLIGFLTVYFSAMRKDKPVFLFMWIMLPAFLMHGVFFEIIVTQISTIALLFIYKSRVTLQVRYFFNATLYFILSIASAAVFHLVGGVVGSLEFWPLLVAVFCYQIAHTVLNDLILRIYATYSKNKLPYFWNDTLWDYGTAFLTLPFCLILYYLIHFIGNWAFILLGIPYFLLILILRLYNNSEKINDNLQQVGEIGHSLSQNLTEDEVINQFLEKSSKLFNAEFVYLFDHKEGWLELIRSYEEGKFVDNPSLPLASSEGIVGAVLRDNHPVIYTQKEDWTNIARSQSRHFPDTLESVLCIPISRNQEIEGALFLSTERKNAFKEFQVKTLDILCSYFTVSVEKARYVEEAVMKSERCALTKLYNYIYLEERLDIEMVRLKKGVLDELSILILDIDHFKRINDTYGHQSGNDILSELAKILEDSVPAGGIVARYGGEEFVYLLPNKSKREAMNFAEKLRKGIESHKFQVTPDLSGHASLVNIQITVSVGVSTAPEDTDEAKALLRNADRSLYLGAKQAGRNRVASYIK